MNTKPTSDIVTNQSIANDLSLHGFLILLWLYHWTRWGSSILVWLLLLWFTWPRMVRGLGSHGGGQSPFSYLMQTAKITH